MPSAPAMAAQTTGSHSGTTVPEKACKVTASSPYVAQPIAKTARLQVRTSTSSVRRWAAYGGSSLLAPKTWTCTGMVYEDGGNVFVVSPPDGPAPTFSMATRFVVPQSTEGIVVWGEPACGGCIASMVGGLFSVAGTMVLRFPVFDQGAVSAGKAQDQPVRGHLLRPAEGQGIRSTLGWDSPVNGRCALQGPPLGHDHVRLASR